MYRSSLCNTWRILVSFFPVFTNWLSIVLWKQRCLNILEVKFYGYSPSTQLNLNKNLSGISSTMIAGHNVLYLLIQQYRHHHHLLVCNFWSEFFKPLLPQWNKTIIQLARNDHISLAERPKLQSTSQNSDCHVLCIPCSCNLDEVSAKHSGCLITISSKNYHPLSNI